MIGIGLGPGLEHIGIGLGQGLEHNMIGIGLGLGPEHNDRDRLRAGPRAIR